ncbi:MAG: acetolactate synthase small subunit [Leptospirales bacterium]
MKHILSVLVNNSSGVLSHVTSLFTRRGYNIDSLSVAETENKGRSIITMVVNEEKSMIAQIEKQLYKLMDVISIENLSNRDSLERELVLITVKVVREKREEILSLVDLFKAHIVDMSEEAVLMELVGNPRRVRSFIRALSEYGIIRMARTGTVSLPFPSAEDE